MATSNTPTPHIEAREGEIARTILLPGDPLRAKYIADNFMEDVKQFNGTRNMLGYTGTYQGRPVSNDLPALRRRLLVHFSHRICAVSLHPPVWQKS